MNAHTDGFTGPDTTKFEYIDTNAPTETRVSPAVKLVRVAGILMTGVATAFWAAVAAGFVQDFQDALNRPKQDKDGLHFACTAGPQSPPSTEQIPIEVDYARARGNWPWGQTTAKIRGMGMTLLGCEVTKLYIQCKKGVTSPPTITLLPDGFAIKATKDDCTALFITPTANNMYIINITPNAEPPSFLQSWLSSLPPLSGPAP